MPYASEKQRRYFHANRRQLESQGVDVDEWDRESARTRAGSGQFALPAIDLPQAIRSHARLPKEYGGHPVVFNPQLTSEGRAEPDRSIAIGPKFLALDADQQRHILAHEWVHHQGFEEEALDDNEFWSELQSGKLWGAVDKDGISWGPGGRKPSENLVESVVAYINEPEWLKQKYPGAHNYVGRLLGKRQKSLALLAGSRLKSAGENCGTGAGGFKPGNTCGKSKKKYAFTTGSAIGQTKLVDTSNWKPGHQSAEGYSKKIAVLDQMLEAEDWDELSSFVPPNPGNNYQKKVGDAWKTAVATLAQKLGKSASELEAVWNGSQSKPVIVTPQTVKPALSIEDKVPPVPKSALHDVSFGDFTDWKKVGKKLGTAPGGVYESGDKTFYVKQHTNKEQAAGEMLAARLYALAGAPILNYHSLKDGDGEIIGTVTDWQTANKADWNNETHRKAASAFFAVHAWLNNRDAIGAGSENPMDNQRWINGTLTSMDVGGALMFGGLGGTKGFGKSADEWDTMRNPGINPTTSKVFGKMSVGELIESAKLLEKIQPEDIYNLVEEFVSPNGMGGMHKGQIINILSERRKAILQKAKDLAASSEKLAATLGGGPTNSAGDKSLPSAGKLDDDLLVSPDVVSKQLQAIGVPAGSAEVFVEKLGTGDAAHVYQALAAELEHVSNPEQKAALAMLVNSYAHKAGKPYVNVQSPSVAKPAEQPAPAVPSEGELASALMDAGMTSTGANLAHSASKSADPLTWLEQYANAKSDHLPAQKWAKQKILQAVEKLKQKPATPQASEKSTPVPQSSQESTPVPPAIPQPPSVSWGSAGVGLAAKNKLVQLYNAAASGGLDALENVKLSFHKNSYGKAIHAYKAKLVEALNAGAKPAVASLEETQPTDVMADSGQQFEKPITAEAQSPSAAAIGSKLAAEMEKIGFVKNGYFVNMIRDASDPHALLQKFKQNTGPAHQYLFKQLSGEPAAPPTPKNPVPLKDSDLPPKPEFITSNMAQKASNEKAIDDLYKIATTHAGHVAINKLNATGSHPSPKVQAYKTALISAIKDALSGTPGKANVSSSNLGKEAFGRAVLDEIAAAKAINAAALKSSHLPKAVTPKLHVGKKIASYLVLGSPAYDPGMPSNVKTSHEALRKISEAAWNSSPAKYKNAMYEYTNSEYKTVNKDLRAGKANAGIKDIASFVTKKVKELPTGTHLARGLTLSDEAAEKLLGASGQIIAEPGYTSTCLNGNGCFGGNVRWEISAGPGARALHAAAFSDHSSENEVIFPPNQRYYIHKVIKQEGRYTVFATALPTEDAQCCEAA